MAKAPSLDGAYDLKTPEDNIKLYAEWADTYDKAFADDHGFILPQMVAAAFAAAGGRGPVLDVGAGTGLAGAALADLNIGPIDALDISAEMLDVAQKKGIYRTSIKADILRRCDEIADNAYDGIISSGTFTMGHVGPDALDEILRIANFGALVTVAINEKHYNDAGFEAKLDDLRGQIKGLSLTRSRIYDDAAKGAHADDTALIAQFVVS